MVRENERQAELEQKQKERDIKLKAQEHAQFIKSQMTKPQLGYESHLVKKFVLGGMMNADEVKMNRDLLNKISSYKKLGGTASSAAIRSPTASSI